MSVSVTVYAIHNRTFSVAGLFRVNQSFRTQQMRAVRLKSLNDSDWLVPLELLLTAHGLATTCKDQFALGILDHNFAPVRDRDRIHPIFFA